MVVEDALLLRSVCTDRVTVLALLVSKAGSEAVQLLYALLYGKVVANLPEAGCGGIVSSCA